jgi:hypothetical protein
MRQQLERLASKSSLHTSESLMLVLDDLDTPGGCPKVVAVRTQDRAGNRFSQRGSDAKWQRGYAAESGQNLNRD